jgi:hypothetical protein
VQLVREQIRAIQARLFLNGYLDLDSGQYVPFFPEPEAFSHLWDLWRGSLPQYAPPPQYFPPALGSETPATRTEMFCALDGLTRRLEELFGPDPDPRDHRSALPVTDASPTGAATGTPPPDSPAVTGGTAVQPAGYTLGRLVAFLDDLDRRREFHRLQQQSRLSRDPIGAALNETYSTALRWRPDEGETPGIGRIELLCDLEPGDPGITAVKVRRLRAKICQQRHWPLPVADELALADAADLLEGVQRVTLDELEEAGRQHIHHGLTTLDTIDLGTGPGIRVTGLSCKVVAGTTPTACPDANPVLPPSLLPHAERAIRRLHPLPSGTTIHWVGHDTGVRSRCRCHPAAPYAAPFDRERWAAVAGGERPTAVAPPEHGLSTQRQLFRDTLALLDEAARLLARFGEPTREFAGVTAAWAGWLTRVAATNLTDAEVALRGLLDRAPGAPHRRLPEELADVWLRVKCWGPGRAASWDEFHRSPHAAERVAAGEALAACRRNLRHLFLYLGVEPPVNTGDAAGQPQPRSAASKPVPSPTIDEDELAVLNALYDRRPVLVKNVDVEEAADLSKQKVGGVIAALIGKGLVIRPSGERKGATLTPDGEAMVERLR